MEVQIFYTIYKITNLINNKIYIGCHKTINLNDNYFGSGTKIKEDINKYGKDNFKKEYLFFVSNQEEMYDMESKIVNEIFINDENTYNIVKGGYGWNKMNDEYKKQITSKAGSWKDKEKRLKILENIPIDKRIKIGKDMGDKYGGKNKLTDAEINDRLFKSVKNKKYYHASPKRFKPGDI